MIFWKEKTNEPVILCLSNGFTLKTNYVSELVLSSAQMHYYLITSAPHIFVHHFTTMTEQDAKPVVRQSMPLYLDTKGEAYVQVSLVYD